MKKKFKNSIVAFAILGAVAVVFSSCNRGMGCPNNFSLDMTSYVISGVDTPAID